MIRSLNKKKVVEKANVVYHTTLANNYEKTQPHFRKENKKQVREILKTYSKRTAAEKVLDLGCGTGFILSLAQPYFKKLYGVDITPAMLKIASKKFKKEKIENIQLIKTSTEKLPFNDSFFDVITAYSFLHHLDSVTPTIKEAYRTLKKGGIFYSDLDPNYYFWDAVKKSSIENNVSDLLKKDIRSICNMTDGVKEIAEGLDEGTIKNAEYIESNKGGFKAEVLKNIFYKIGFKQVNITYHWFWQEGKVITDISLKNAIYFESHLRKALPITKNLFKYFRIEAIK